MLNIIKNYINNMNIKDLNILLIKNDIHLNNNELDILYNHLKNDWYTFIYEDSTPILNDIKNSFTPNNYNKLYNIYINAKEKYKNYLWFLISSNKFSLNFLDLIISISYLYGGYTFLPSLFST